MKTSLEIINKMTEKEAVKLGMNVELGLKEDLALAVKNAKAVSVTYAKSKDKIVKSIASIKSDIEALKLNKDYGKKQLVNAQKFKAQLDKLSKELGVSLTGTEPDKLLNELYDFTNSAQGDIDDALLAINSIK